MMLALKHNSFGPLGGAGPSFWEPLLKPMIIFIVVTALLLSYFQPRPLFLILWRWLLDDRFYTYFAMTSLTLFTLKYLE